jgi:hypothetical protein
MGKVIQFDRAIRAKPSVTAPRPLKRKKGGKPKYIGLNIYISPERADRLRIIKRNILHGILSAFGWRLTKRLFLKLFERGGAFFVRCRAADIDVIREQIEMRLPDLVVRKVRAA